MLTYLWYVQMDNDKTIALGLHLDFVKKYLKNLS